MKSINPKIILPIVALFVMLAQESFGIKFTDQQLQIVNDALLSIVALSGIFVSPTKEDEE